ncbi:MAG TPA: hypothetical protein VGR76_10555 [Candidatus Angelobacter sp.]|jgi:hypothetical protein|nr:hypothetical protein [Candidatus Angelobacter sp.]
MGIASLGGLLSGSGNVSAPSGVGGIYGHLLSSYLGNQGNIFNAARTWQPQYAGLAAGTLGSLAPNVTNTVNSINPASTALLAQLGNTASSQLAAGTQLDPGAAFQAQQQLRGSQAARGLGYSPGDAFSEALAMTGMGQQMLQQREALAGNVAGQQFQQQTSPALGLLTGVTSTATPSIISPGQQSNFISMPYQGKLQAAGQTAANNTGLYQSMDSNQTNMATSAMSLNSI